MPPKFGGGAKCPRCDKTVYKAEEVLMAGASWHKTCFVCEKCKKSLDSTTVADKDGKIFCKSCYGKEFGPKGYGYGGGAGTLTNTGADVTTPMAALSVSASHSPSPSPNTVRKGFTSASASTSSAAAGSDICPKCNTAVFHVERVLAAGQSWHKKCAVCKECKKALDSTTLQEHDKELYCSSCHKKSFGPKGFRGGTAGGVVHTE